MSRLATYFRNDTTRTLDFDVEGERFVVPPGGGCEIPRRLAYVIASRGLPLTKLEDGDALPGALVEPTRVAARPNRPPPGVHTGRVRPEELTENTDAMFGVEDDETDGEPGVESSELPAADVAEESDGAAAVAAAVKDLEAQGATLPKGRKRGR